MKRLLVLVSLGSAACWLPTEPSSRAYTPLPENRGALLTSLGNTLASTPFEWSADGGTLYLVSMKMNNGPWSYLLREVTVATKAARDLAELSTDVHDLLLSADESALFYTRVGGASMGGPTLFRAPLATGTPLMVDDTLDWAIGSTLHVQRVARAAGDDIVFLRKPRTLVVRNAAGDERVVAQNCRGIAALSPARDRVLCVTGESPLAFAAVTIADGAETPMSVPENSNLPHEVHWGANGPQFIYTAGTASSVRIATLGTSSVREVFAETVADLSAGNAWDYSFSPDGSTVAFWRWECTNSTGFLSCDYQNLLTLLDVDDLTTRRVAVVHQSNDDVEGPSRLTWSPDGSTLVYHFKGSVYAVQAGTP